MTSEACAEDAGKTEMVKLHSSGHICRKESSTCLLSKTGKQHGKLGAARLDLSWA
jgi:hypothetical protein